MFHSMVDGFVEGGSIFVRECVDVFWMEVIRVGGFQCFVEMCV